MDNMLQKITDCSQYIKERIDIPPEIGIVLGTGLGALVDDVRADRVIPYDELPHFPVSTVESHHGNFIFGELNGRSVAVMQGRFHYYEGYSMKQVTFPIRVMKELGIDTVLLSNAAGGMNRNMKRGDLMVIADHINLMGDNPLLGPNEPTLGPRFPDMMNTYDPLLRKMAFQVGADERIFLHQGIYAAVPGPNFETSAEYRYLSFIGADAVGMSTVPEVLVARHAAMRVFAVSCITDLAIDGVVEPVSGDVVIQAAREAEPKMTTLIRGLIGKIQR